MKKRSYELQLFSWAIDRAIRVHEVNKTQATAESIAAFADQLCGVIMDNIPSETEADPTEAEAIKQDAINHGEAPENQNEVAD